MLRFRFPIVIIDEDFRSENTSGLGIRALAEAIEKEGFEVLGATSYGDLSQFAQQQSRASAFILSIDDEEFTPRPGARPGGAEPAQVHQGDPLQERRDPDLPVRRDAHLAAPARTTSCASCTASSTCSRTRRSSSRGTSSARRAATSTALAPPFFRALVDYAQDGSYSWHCPGHSGGVAFLKSPVGQMFHQFFGENMLRADVCNAVDELGQLLDHTGPVAASERNAARIFNADHCFFVTNGTSTSATRWCGTTRWRRATWWWSTATATSRSCTRSS